MAPEAGIVAAPRFEVIPDWLKLPPGLSFGEVPDLKTDIAPHGIAIDSIGDLYVGETPTDGSAAKLHNGAALPTIQKFRRLS